MHNPPRAPNRLEHALPHRGIVLAQCGRASLCAAQEIVRDFNSIASMDLSRLRYPIVLKPARSVSERAGVRATFSVTYASDASELQRKLRALPPAAFPLLLQQRVVGPGMGIFLLLWDGELKAQFAHQR